MVLEIDVVLPQVLDFLNKVILVCFGMRLVDALKFACSTSTANIWSGPVTLVKKKHVGKLASTRRKTCR